MNQSANDKPKADPSRREELTPRLDKALEGAMLEDRPANDFISAAERRRREDAASFALASVGLEGSKPSKAALAQTRRHINGEIQLSELVQVKPDAEFSAAERRRREAAVNFARANVGLEGFKLSKADEKHAQRFINGEIQLAEFVQRKPDAE